MSLFVPFLQLHKSLHYGVDASFVSHLSSMITWTQQHDTEYNCVTYLTTKKLKSWSSLFTKNDHPNYKLINIITNVIPAVWIRKYEKLLKRSTQTISQQAAKKIHFLFQTRPVFKLDQTFNCYFTFKFSQNIGTLLSTVCLKCVEGIGCIISKVEKWIGGKTCGLKWQGWTRVG